MQDSLQRGLKLYLHWTLWRKSWRAMLHMKASRRAFIRGEETSCTCNHALVSNHRAPLSFPQQCEEKRFTMPPILPIPPPLQDKPLPEHRVQASLPVHNTSPAPTGRGVLLKKHNPHERLSFLVRSHSGGHGVRTGREDAVSPLCLDGRRGRFMV